MAEQLQKDQNNINKVLYPQSLFYIPKMIYFKLISQYHNNPLVDYFEINKNKKFIAKKYYWPFFDYNIKAYIKDYNIYLASKVVRYKSYRDL